LPSLRRDKQTTDSEYGLNATPEFKSFVAKKLSEEIDRSYGFTKHKNKDVVVLEPEISKTKKKENGENPSDIGIRIFSTSNKPIS